MIGYFSIIFLSTLQGSLVVSDNDHEHYSRFDGHEFDRVLFLFGHV